MLAKLILVDYLSSGSLPSEFEDETKSLLSRQAQGVFNLANFLHKLDAIKAFLAEFSGSAVFRYDLDLASLGASSSAPNRLCEFYQNLLAQMLNPLTSDEDITIWLLNEKIVQIEAQQYSLFPSTNLTDKDNLELAFTLLEALISKLDLSNSGSKLYQALTPVACQFLNFDSKSLYHTTNNSRISALKLLTKLGIRTPDVADAVLATYELCQDREIRAMARELLTANKQFVHNILLAKIITAPKNNQSIYRFGDLCDKICGVADLKHFTEIFPNSSDQQRLSKVAALLNGQIKIGQFFRSPYVNEKMTLIKSDSFSNNLEALIAFKQSIDNINSNGFMAMVKVWGIDSVQAMTVEPPSGTFLVGLINASVKAALEETSENADSSAARCVTYWAHSQWLSQDFSSQIKTLSKLLCKCNSVFNEEMFGSIFAIIAQRDAQHLSIKRITDDGTAQIPIPPILPCSHPSSVFYPLIDALIVVTKLHKLSFPSDAFLETEASCLLNTFYSATSRLDLGYQDWRLNTLLDLLPTAINHDEKIQKAIRDSVQTVDDNTHNRHPLLAFMRIRNHSHSSPFDWTFCNNLLDCLVAADPGLALSEKLIPLMGHFGAEQSALNAYLAQQPEDIKEWRNILLELKQQYAEILWEDIAEDELFDTRISKVAAGSAESREIAKNLLILANFLHKRWCRRLADKDIIPLLTNENRQEWLLAKLPQRIQIIQAEIKSLRLSLHKPSSLISAQQTLLSRRHAGGRQGIIPSYREAKYTNFQTKRTLAILKRQLLQEQINIISQRLSKSLEKFDAELLKDMIGLLTTIMDHIRQAGLTPSSFFIDTISALKKDKLSITQLMDIFALLRFREANHFDGFVSTGYQTPTVSAAEHMQGPDFDLDYNLPTDMSGEKHAAWAAEKLLAQLHAGASKAIQLLTSSLDLMLEYVNKNLAEPFITLPLILKGPKEFSPVTHSYKAFTLNQMLKRLKVKIPAFEVLPVDLFLKQPELLTEKGRPQLLDIVIDQILLVEERSGKIFDFSTSPMTGDQKSMIAQARAKYPFDISIAPPLTLSIRGGSYRSMPGILGTVLHAGRKPLVLTDWEKLPEEEARALLEEERVFLATYGNVVHGISQVEFSKIILDIKSKASKQESSQLASSYFWGNVLFAQQQFALASIAAFFGGIGSTGEEVSSKHQPIDKLSNAELWETIVGSRGLIAEKGFSPEVQADPLSLIANSVVSIWNSWDSEAARQMRKDLNISDDWHSAIMLQDMRAPQKHPKSFSAILFTGDPNDTSRPPFGDLSFGMSGEDLASGMTNGVSLSEIAQQYPHLNQRIKKLLEEIYEVSGFVHMDVELVGEYDPKRNDWEFFLLQTRQLPIGKPPPSTWFDINPGPTAPAHLAKGEGVLGGAQQGVIINAIGLSLEELRKKVEVKRMVLGKKDKQNGPAIFILLDNATPEESLKINIPDVDGVLTTQGGSCHASISARREGKLYIANLQLLLFKNNWGFFNGNLIKFDNHIYTVVGHPPHRSPQHSGAIFEGKMPLQEREVSHKEATKQL